MRAPASRVSAASTLLRWRDGREAGNPCSIAQIGRRRGSWRSCRVDVASLCRECAESVTGNLHDTTTPAPGPRPVVLPMLFMVRRQASPFEPGLSCCAGFRRGCDGARPPARRPPARLPPAQRRVPSRSPTRGRAESDSQQTGQDPAGAPKPPRAARDLGRAVRSRLTVFGPEAIRLERPPSRRSSLHPWIDEDVVNLTCAGQRREAECNLGVAAT